MAVRQRSRSKNSAPGRKRFRIWFGGFRISSETHRTENNCMRACFEKDAVIPGRCCIDTLFIRLGYCTPFQRQSFCGQVQKISWTTAKTRLGLFARAFTDGACKAFCTLPPPSSSCVLRGRTCPSVRPNQQSNGSLASRERYCRRSHV